MSTLTVIRSYTLLRPRPLIGAVQLASRRPLHLSAIRREPSSTRPDLNSTALQPSVKAREEYIGSEGSIVGGSGKGSEGSHFEGQSFAII